MKRRRLGVISNTLFERSLHTMKTYCFLSLLVVASYAQAADRPNIVILYADDMGYGDLGAQNPESKIPTPNLDKLAAQGMRFTDAHSSSGVCTPSRYALLTGRFHWRKFHGIVNSFDQPALDEAEHTLPELLKANGYRTACIGKWHLGWNWNEVRNPKPQAASKQRKVTGGFQPDDFDWEKPITGGPLSHGFDYYFGDDVPNFPPYAWFENDRLITIPTVSLKITAETAEGNWEARPGPSTPNWDFSAVAPRLKDQAVDWIRKQQGADQPFFLYVPFNTPHAPIIPNAEYRGKSKAGGYGDFVVQTDDHVGQILQAIEAHGFADNTLVIFSGDNGPEHYAYERLQKFNHRSAGPLRGLKRDLYEGGHRVPFVVRWPGKVKPGAVNDEMVSQVDLMATLASVAGFKLPENSAHDSYDLLSTFTGDSKSPRHTIVHNTIKGAYAIRHHQWVLIQAKTGAHSNVPGWFDKRYGYDEDRLDGELYDLSKDIAQKNNLYASMPEKVKELAAILSDVRSKGQVRHPSP
jgi:arylsulfatase A